MMLTDEERRALVTYRMQRARETWAETKIIIEDKLWYAAANRMYYSCFYMTSALLISYGLAASTHAGVIRMLGMHFVMTGIVSKELNSFYVHLFEMRQRGDYDDYIQIGSADVLPFVELAEKYMTTLETIINEKMQP
ncbi:MAG: HEPN domain-containing protein [Prevotella sp.]|nr:HEPN domain-containing protein [Prevotella sp.]